MQRAHGFALDAGWQALVKDIGAEPAAVLRRAGLSLDLLHRDAVRLSTPSWFDFWSALEREADDPCFALHLVEAMTTEAFSPPLFAALCSQHLAAAARRLAHYKRLVAPMRLDIDEDDVALRLELVWLESSAPPPASLIAVELLFLVNLARVATREHIVPRAVTTSAALPEPVGPYTDWLGVAVESGVGHAVTFAREDAHRLFLTANDAVWRVFEPELRRRLEALDAPATVGARLRATLLEALPGGECTIDGVASRLAMSTRTLQRRLRQEGTSFRRVLQDTRESLARHYLTQTGLPGAEISFLLGFEEPNSFYRAFHEWTGTTPESLRASTG